MTPLQSSATGRNRSGHFFSFVCIALLPVITRLWATIQDAISLTNPDRRRVAGYSTADESWPNKFMTSQMATSAPSVLDDKRVFYNRFLLIVAGLGGLLYGVDVGIIAGALPYLEATSTFTRSQLSTVVAEVLLGSVISPLSPGYLPIG